MSRIQLKFTIYIKNQDNYNMNKKRKSIDANTEDESDVGILW